jgi:8-hydroxy-5-deazaflavin:NADPH oxidoreductase
MRIGIIGSGMIGGTLAELLASHGHDVALANSRGPESLREFAARHPGITPSLLDQAVSGADLVIVAIPFGRYRDLPAAGFAGQVVVDATNYNPNRDGHLSQLDGGASTSSELLATHLAGARVVKAFNTIYFEQLRSQSRPGTPAGQRRALPIAGDDATAKENVAALIAELGFTAVDVGGLAEGRTQQPGSPVFNVTVTATELRRSLGGGPQ